MAPVLHAVTERLRAAGCVYAEEEAALLVATSGDIDELVARRVAGEPLEQVVGWAAFGELRIGVRPGVFVPRRRTEFLVEQAVKMLPPDGVVVDLCCGSAAVALLIREHRPDAEIYASDIDPVAIACARDNVATQTAEISVVEGDLFEPLPQNLRGRVDVLVANTPYVPTEAVAFLPVEARDHEPRHTLDGGPDGLMLLRRIATEATDWLRPRGRVLIEISYAQVDPATSACTDSGLDVSIAVSAEDRTAVLIGQSREVRSS